MVLARLQLVPASMAQKKSTSSLASSNAKIEIKIDAWPQSNELGDNNGACEFA